MLNRYDLACGGSLDYYLAQPVTTSLHPRAGRVELETLAETLKQPLPPDPFEEESACRRVVAAVQTLAGELTVSRPPSVEVPATPLPERLEHFRILKLLGRGAWARFTSRKTPAWGVKSL
jgi:hypothetical protein